MKFTATLYLSEVQELSKDFFELDIARLVEFKTTSTPDYKKLRVELIPLQTAEKALISSFEDGLLSDWNDIFSVRSKCPFDGVNYHEIPGYKTGFGCPVCKGGGIGHLTIFGLKEVKEAMAKTKELKEKAGAK